MKRIILLLDGTWNDSDQGPADTNIVRLREIISKCLGSEPVTGQGPIVTPSSSSNRLSISTGHYASSSRQSSAALEHLVYYERGVGTGGFFDLYLGGAFGVGLGRNIRRAYRFLSQNYVPDDQVFVFGFSRGSYTARSLVGLINAVGLLQSNFCTEANEAQAWACYRTNPSDRAAPTTKLLRSYAHRDFRVSCLGVFDTVGALGIPMAAFWRENRDLFEFHDVGLGDGKTLHLHALAIDEHRSSFEPTLWRRPKFGNTSANAEQVWFAGAHSDIGGGNVDEEHGRNSPALDDLTLDWMIKRVLARFEDFPVKQNGERAWPECKPMAACAPQDEPRRGFYRTLPFAWRSINNLPVPCGVRQQVVARDRHAETIGEAIHLSALQRLGQPIRVRGSMRYYRPSNLVCVLDELVRNYGTRGALGVVGYSGEIMAREEVRGHVNAAHQRLIKAEAMSL